MTELQRQVVKRPDAHARNPGRFMGITKPLSTKTGTYLAKSSAAGRLLITSEDYPPVH